MTKALIVVDVQNDFCEGGSLGVNGGNKVASEVARYATANRDKYDMFVFTKDYHNAPPDDNGGHFALPPAEPDYVDTWPVHCVAGTEGSEYHPQVKTLVANLKAAGETVAEFRKGQGRPDYSGFQGYTEDAMMLGEYLAHHRVTKVDVVGIAGDHCVKATALDALEEGFTTEVLPEMVASVGGIEATMATVKAVTGYGYNLQG